MGMKVEQFVMAYKADQDRLRAMLPEGFSSLRPVLRINAEIRQEEQRETVYLEFNTPVEGFGKRGWLNIGHWESGNTQLSYERRGPSVTVQAPFLEITYTGVGTIGGCPAEKDHDGCVFLGDSMTFRAREVIAQNKEYCNCSFAWCFAPGDARGASTDGTSVPAFFAPPQHNYEQQALSPQNAAAIPCQQVLGSYKVCFDR